MEPLTDLNRGGACHTHFIMDNAGKIQEFYKMEKKLGSGSIGSVSRAKNLSTGSIRAVKMIPKSQVKNIERFKHEVDILKKVDHPNIIKLYETFEEHKNIYLVMELCSGGELFDKIIEVGRFSEVQAAILMQQIFRAVYYLHENYICHRDLKPENMLFVSKDPIDKNTLRIVDFGLACKFEPGQFLTAKAGTPYYVAPQVLAGKYDQLSDCWSCGVIAYVMLCGHPPFFGDTDTEVMSKVRSGKFSFDAADWKDISEDAKNLVRMLLQMDPQDRFTAEQALNHDWIKHNAPNSHGLSFQAGFVDNLRKFQSQNKLKKAVLHIIARQLDDEHIRNIRDSFTALDRNGDGRLTAVEMREGLSKAGFKDIPADLQHVLNDVDSNGSGVIDYTEFLAAALDKGVYLQEDVCWSAFRLFDRNGDAKISVEELKCVLDINEVKDILGGNDIAAIMQQVDSSGDGEIDFQEFMAMMRG